MILGIESSCDETAVALLDPQRGPVGSWIASQVELHAAYGGVVPDLASREHLRAFGPLLGRVWTLAPPETIRRIAVTTGPGLAGCLAMGIAAARTIALATGAELVPVNHLRAHAFSVFASLQAEDPAGFPGALARLLPQIGLVVSGGNTLLLRIEQDFRLTVLAETWDDAAGEALDKGAKLLGLGYPGGPLIERLASTGDPTAFPFPRPIPRSEDPRFSFSGLKTALRNLAASLGEAGCRARLPDICASYQAAVLESLIRKTRAAIEAATPASLGLSGGVANNRVLRSAWQDLGDQFGLPVRIAEPALTGDNAAMVALAAHADRRLIDPAVGETIEIRPSWRPFW